MSASSNQTNDKIKISDLSALTRVSSQDILIVTTKQTNDFNAEQHITYKATVENLFNSQNFGNLAYKDTIIPTEIDGQLESYQINGLSALAFKDQIEISDVNSLQTKLDSKVSSVVVTPIKTTGTKIATITVDGSSTDIYSGTSGTGSGPIDNLGALAFKDKIEIADVNLLQTTLNSKVSNVTVAKKTTTGTKIATITVDGSSTDIYSGTSGTGSGQSGVANIGIGTIVAFAGISEIPDNTLLCDGREVSKSDYKSLYDVIGDRYGTATTGMFKLPNLTNRFIEGCSSLSEVGSYLAAGLPNITGTLDTFKGDYSGAFQKADKSGEYGGNGTGHFITNFSASYVNSIYKDDCDTVQPPAVMMRYVIVYTALNDQVNTFAVAQPQGASYVIETGRFNSDDGTAHTDNSQNDSWYRLYSDGWCEQGGVKVKDSNIEDNQIQSMSLLHGYTDSNYFIMTKCRQLGKGNNTDFDCTVVIEQHNNSFNVDNPYDSFYWEAKGFTR